MSLFHRLLHTPRRTLMRRAAFQIHLWCGVVIGLYTALIGLTGSGLVFRDEIERALRPNLYVLAPAVNTAPRPTLDQLLATATKALPDWQPRGFEQLSETPATAPTEPVLLFMVRRPGHDMMAPHSFTPDQLMAYLDPQTGALLGSRSRYAGVLGFAANLHFYLLAGRRGYPVNGALAIAFLGIALTGWILWWPGIRRAFSALRIHGLHRSHHGTKWNWKRLNWDLHSVGGFWSNPALIAIIVTGIFFTFSQPILRVIAFTTRTDPRIIRDWYSDPKAPSHLPGAKPITMQEAWVRASGALPPGIHIHYLSISSRPDQAFEAIAYHPRTAPYAQPMRVYIDPYQGSALKRFDSHSLPLPMRAVLYVYAIHFGSFAGLFSRILWFCIGLLPAGLLITGLIMWWNRSLRQTLLKRSAFKG